MVCLDAAAARATPLIFLLVFAAAAAGEVINPYPRQLIRTETLKRWTFDEGLEGWVALHQCVASAGDGVLRIKSTGRDPYLLGPEVKLKAPVAVRLRMKCATGGGGQVFWRTVQSPRWGERQTARFKLIHDGQWHDYEVPLDFRGTLTGLRLDPGSAPGEIEIDWIEITQTTWHPLEIQRVETREREVVVHVRNHSARPIQFSVGGKPTTVAGGDTVRVPLRAGGKAPFEAFPIAVEAKGLPPIRRTVFLHHAQARGGWATRRSNGLTVRVARDGSGARLERGGQTVAVIAPLVRSDDATPKLILTDTEQTRGRDAPPTGPVRFRGKGITVECALRGDELSVAIRSERACEGPVLRALGPLEQGLFAGLEYLGKGERSSSKLDIETPEHVRFAPDRLKVTMPLMACVTDRGAAAMTWSDMSLQPVYASPNFFDGIPDHRMALRGRKIEATVTVRPGPLEDVILWAVKKRGLPPLPKPPRSRQAQWALCLKALNGPLKGEGGWGHCAGPRWTRHPYAAFASTIWRMTGKIPEMPRLAGGGSHVRNDAMYFVTGRARQWLAMRRNQAKGIIRRQKPDGSFRYKGKYRRGHFEDTASGFCARPAATLLDYAWLTGDQEALKAGLKTLDYMRRFRTPRGAQTWELSLHTPDILASAYLVWAYVRGYELTGKDEYLALARKWALSGIPFVYQWRRYPIMLYATIPVFGATNWRGNWMGRPVQWCGGVYAYALALLAPHDQSLDWEHLARGILISAEQQQYPDGRFAGCLPDALGIASQSRYPANINPCALVSLRLILDGEVDSLAVATDGKHRVAAPFPVEIRDGKAHIRAKRGLTYQILVDGTRILDIQSEGTDVVPLP